MHKASGLSSNFDGFSKCRASQLHESAAMYYLATVSGAQPCFGIIAEHPTTVLCSPALYGFHERPDGGAAGQNSVHVVKPASYTFLAVLVFRVHCW